MIFKSGPLYEYICYLYCKHFGILHERAHHRNKNKFREKGFFIGGCSILVYPLDRGPVGLGMDPSLALPNATWNILCICCSTLTFHFGHFLGGQV